MKKLLMAMVFAGMAGGTYAADFSDLQNFKVSDIKMIVAADVAPSAVELTNTPEVFYPESKSDTNNGTAWTNSNLAHVKTWIHLRVLEQHNMVFRDAGDLKVSAFPIWLEGNSHRSAEQLATMLDSFFCNLDRAKRNTPKSRDLLAGLLLAGRSNGKDVRWLADGIDELYNFRGESKQTVLKEQLEQTPGADALDRSRRAHLTVWTTLLVTDQFFEVFGKSGQREIAAFSVWREGNSPTRASNQLADRMDAVFRVHGAKNNYPESRANLARLLVAGRDGGKNVRWLADGIDELYTFWKE